MSATLNTQTASALKAARERGAVKAADLAEAMGLSVDALYRIESGKTTISIKHIAAAAAALGYTPDGLLSALASDVRRAS